MSKRANGEGSIIKRGDGRWMARISMPSGRKCFYGDTRADVDAQLTAAKNARHDGKPIDVDRTTLAGYAAEWLDLTRDQLRVGNWRKHEERMRRHILPTLGRVSIAQLSVSQIESLYGALRRGGLSGQTVRHVHATLHKCLADAERSGRAQRNVARLVKTPRVEHREMQAWTEEQMNALLDTAAGHPLETLFVVALTTGMRRGELLGLRWRDVDLERREIHLRATLERYHGVMRFAEPKTRGSRRKILLTKRAADALRAHRTAQRVQQLAAGAAWANLDVVFATEIGQPVAESTLQRTFRAVIKAAGVPQIRFHDMRHTALTILLTRGVHPKVVSELAGHSRTTVTLDTYSHVMPSIQREAVTAMEAAVGGAS